MKNIKNILELLTLTLTTYLSKLSKNNLNEISENIMKNYLNNKLIIQKSILYKIPVLYSKIELKKLKFYLLKWKMNIHQKNILFNINNNSNISYNNSSNSSLNLQLIDFNNEIKNNLTYLNMNSNNFSTPIKENYINLTLNNSPNLFFQRLENYKKIYNQNQKNILNTYEEEDNILHPFIPKINNKDLIKLKNKKPAHLRLYNDSIERRNKKIELENKINIKSSNKKINDEKIMELYNDYKIRKINQKYLVNKIDLERGFTFTPNISQKKIKNLNRSFDNSKKRKNQCLKCKNHCLNKSVENKINDNFDKLNSLDNKKKFNKNTSNNNEESNKNKIKKNLMFIYDYIRNNNKKKINEK